MLVDIQWLIAGRTCRRRPWQASVGVSPRTCCLRTLHELSMCTTDISVSARARTSRRARVRIWRSSDGGALTNRTRVSPGGDKLGGFCCLGSPPFISCLLLPPPLDPSFSPYDVNLPPSCMFRNVPSQPSLLLQSQRRATKMPGGAITLPCPAYITAMFSQWLGNGPPLPHQPNGLIEDSIHHYGAVPCLSHSNSRARLMNTAENARNPDAEVGESLPPPHLTLSLHL